MNLSSIAGSLTTPQTPDLGAGKKPTKLHEAAQQFEALLVGEMMKSVRESGDDGWMGSGGETGDDSAMSMAEGQFSQAIASSGGLGLARIIEQRMGPQVAAHNAALAHNPAAGPGKPSGSSKS